MIRRFDGTADCAHKITAQSKRGAIWAVVWSWRKHRICLTRMRAQESVAAWKAWKERQGWKVKGSLASHYIATDPLTGHQEACLVHRYDFRTRERTE